MPKTFRPDSDPAIAANALPVSPREAAMHALVYRRRLRERPRDRLLRVAAWVGTILIHLVFLFGMILGPAYDILPPPPSPPDENALLVRLIDKPPPPVPPVRGTPSKAPVAKTRWNTPHSKASRASSGSHASAVASATKTPPAIAVPVAPPPRVKPDVKPKAPPPSVAAVAQRPLTQPKAPPPQPDLAKVPVPTQAPPDLALDTPKPQVVPPRFQPEPVRKAQVEGTAPMPPPASLALPETPAAQMAVTPTPPTITAERTTPVPTTAITLATVPRPEVEESSAPPTPQDTPLPAVAPEPSAPTPDLAIDHRPVPPKVAVTVEAVHAPAVEAEADLEAVPLPDATAKPTVSAPAADRPAPAIQAPAVTPGELQRPVAGADVAPAPPGQAPGDNAAGQSTAQNQAEQGKADTERAKSTAQGAPAQPFVPGQTTAEASGSNTPGAAAESGTPGAAKGVDEGQRLTGANGTSQRDDGVVGGQGDKAGQVGAYVELKPHGNLVPQSGARVHIDYKATRFEGAWTPKGESSVDTAIRHGVEAATVKPTISLPRGIRINCVAGPGNTGGAMKAVSLFTIGCGGDPPAKPINQDAVAKNQTMAPAKPLADNLPPANSASVAAAPVALDNTALCTTARISGGPMPPGCEATIKVNVPAPSPSSGSWVPASDQFGR
ncbi:hypothetical protein IM816_03250 [Luteibacter flocculans]|uniref:Uncharacterized protein n=1 Tax=Luteibacter flocculans TaxID=2780091 RepID=A0ABY4T2I2_9GAMM|nr:hypothetical protein [Luteibacter flocculans]URL59147.1 hypothetical protein IM816_03250 [Luteibacter flocculans]